MHAVNDDYTIFTNIGFTVHQEGSDSNPFTCKAYLLSFVSDLPAKAAVLNFIQFNGYYGCSKCKQQGYNTQFKSWHELCKCKLLIGCRVSYNDESHGTIHVYPYMESDPCGPERTHEDTIDSATKATAESNVTPLVIHIFT